jgi:hypothetical protein
MPIGKLMLGMVMLPRLLHGFCTAVAKFVSFLFVALACR